MSNAAKQSRRAALGSILAVGAAASIPAMAASATSDTPAADGALPALLGRLRALAQNALESAARDTNAVLAEIEAVPATSPAAILAKIEAAAFFVDDDELDELDGAADRVLFSAVLDLKRLRGVATAWDFQSAGR